MLMKIVHWTTISLFQRVGQSIIAKKIVKCYVLANFAEYDVGKARNSMKTVYPTNATILQKLG